MELRGCAGETVGFWLILSHFFGESKKVSRCYGVAGFLSLGRMFSSLSQFLRTILTWSFPLTSFEEQISPGSWGIPKLSVDPVLCKEISS